MSSSNLCTICHAKAIYRDIKPVNKEGTKRYLHYCESCKKQGVFFGWIEKEDLEMIKDERRR